MSKKNVIWCAHPKHDEITPGGKKRYWKTGPKPSHPKGKRRISQDFADFINEYDERIINGSSRKLTESDYLCSTCFGNEQSNIDSQKEILANVKGCGNYVDCNLDNQLNSPYDDDHIHVEQEHAKMKLNQIFECLNLPIINDM
jgi:hypothetical protein